MASVNKILDDLNEWALTSKDSVTASTVTKILNDLDDYRPKRVPVTKEATIKYGVSKQKQVLLVTGRVQGDTEDDKTHEQKMEFDTKFYLRRKEGFLKLQMGDGFVWMKPITGNTEVRVRCSCSDYYYSFWAWNKKGHSHYGEDMPAYTSTGMRKPRNPEHYMGMCKHLLECLNAMKVKGLFK